VRRRVNAASVAILLAIVSPAIAGSRTEALARCKRIQDGIQRRDCFRSLNGKTKEAPPVPLVQDPRAGDSPATALTIDHPSAAVGQPLCEDRDTLAAMFVAGMLASSPENATTIGCQTIPENAQVQVLERYLTAFHFLRIVKVQVTAPSLPDPKVGYTIEIGR
jgi:hypothetical protein